MIGLILMGLFFAAVVALLVESAIHEHKAKRRQEAAGARGNFGIRGALKTQKTTDVREMFGDRKVLEARGELGRLLQMDRPRTISHPEQQKRGGKMAAQSDDRSGVNRSLLAITASVNRNYLGHRALGDTSAPHQVLDETWFQLMDCPEHSQPLVDGFSRIPIPDDASHA